VGVAGRTAATGLVVDGQDGGQEALARGLEAAGVPWYVLGQSAEGAVAGSWCPPELNLTNRTGLRLAAGVLARSAALVTNDSGPMHLASAVATPVVALFGPTVRAWGFYPAGERDVVLETDMACRPCSLHGGRGCARGGACLAEIRPEAVLEAVLAMV